MAPSRNFSRTVNPLGEASLGAGHEEKQVRTEQEGGIARLGSRVE
ncbi:hypothetical protein [Paenibacillus graminis]|nr:hypothetical protein [Paenibacillus graminis]MEC0171939.1 hypothetical protein [Paenibacillus graminis]